MTVLARKTGILVAAALLVLVGVAALASRSSDNQEQPAKVDTSECLSRGDDDCLIQLEYARTDEQRIRGLSGRERLADDSGMLFDFETESERCMWMKDMEISLDIVWLSVEKTVTHVEKSVAPETYPATFCYQARYVLELNAGVAEKLDLSAGKTVAFP